LIGRDEQPEASGRHPPQAGHGVDEQSQIGGPVDKAKILSERAVAIEKDGPLRV
jgi:hypothetical protein